MKKLLWICFLAPLLALAQPTVPTTQTVMANSTTGVLVSPTNFFTANPVGVTSITGTAAEITASAATGAVTLSLPTALTFTGKTITGGTYASGAFNGTLGATTPSTVAATTITGTTIAGSTRGAFGTAIDSTTALTAKSTSTANGDSVLYTDKQGAVTGTSYNIYASIGGASTTNVAGYFTATGATTNWALQTGSGNTFIANSLNYGGVLLSAAVTGTGNMVLSASPTLTGTLTAAAITASGIITRTATAATLTQYLNVGGSTTGAAYQRVNNSVGDFIFGVESSVGGALLTGSTAYATVLTTVGATALQFGTTDAVRLSFAATTGVATFSTSTASTASTSGSLLLVGGIGINNATDAASATNGGTFTSAGGGAFAKSLWVGTNLTVVGNNGTFSTGTGTANILHGGTTGRFIFDGSSDGLGGNVILYGSAHASFPAQAFYSANTHTLRNVAGTSALTLTTSLATFAAGLTMSGTLTGAATLTGTNAINSAAATALTLGTASFGTAVSFASASGVPTFGPYARTNGTNATGLQISDNLTGASTVGFGTQLRVTSNGGNVASVIGFENGGTGTNNESQIAFYTQASAGALTRQATISSAGLLTLANGLTMSGTLTGASTLATAFSASGLITAAAGLTVSAGQNLVTSTQSPASGAAGTAGTITWDASYIYICTASGVWKRAALTGGY